tara:strand:+ start:149 stop:616 length:468 start_codon:yes stop_codon:yes gene_type:complete
MYNLKKNLNLTVLTGIVSYLYLYSSLLNNNYNIIFIYFAVLLIGYFIVGIKIYEYNLLIIIIDILNKIYKVREGNFESKHRKAKSNAKNNPKFNKDTSKDPGITGDMTEEEGNKLTDKMAEKDEENEGRGKKPTMKDDGSKNEATDMDIMNISPR